MSIIFGWNEFRIKSIKPEEVGIYHKDTPTDLHFEGRQKYFHLFWIPFFGIGKRWVVRHGKNMYPITNDALQAIRSYGIRLHAPWYTFLGPILIVLAGFGFKYYQDVQEKQQEARSIEYQKANAAILTYHLTHINSDALIQITSKKEYEEVFLKVQEVSGQELKCLKLTGFEGRGNSGSTIWQAAKYVKEHPKQEVVVVSRIALEQAFTGEWKRYGADIQGADIFGDSSKWVLNQISFPFAPNLQWGSSSGASRKQGKTTFRLEIMNYGENCEMIDIQTLEGPAIWDKTGLPKKITSGSFPVTGENYSPRDGKLKFRIIVRDEKSQTHTFEFTSSKSGRWVRKVFD